MSFPSAPEYESYVALCRELRLPFPDDEAWQRGSVFEGDPGDLFFAGEQSAEGGQWPTQEAVFVPRLDQLLAMLEGEGVEFVEIGVAWVAPDEALAELAAEGAATKTFYAFDATNHPDSDGRIECPVREEAALRLWMAVTGRVVHA